MTNSTAPTICVAATARSATRIRLVTIRLASVMLAVALPVLPLRAQAGATSRAGWQLTPTFESWSFQQGTTENVRSASQWTLPFVAMFDLGRAVTVDVYGAYAAGEVNYRSGSPEASHSVSGFTDVRVRAAARLRGDGVVATLGIGVPTGKTRLDARELAALRVLGAPSLRAQTPSLGNGLTTTAGLVLTRRVGEWALGVGASYELRGEYSPVEAAALGVVDLDPGEAIRTSVGAERLLGESAMSVSLSATHYNDDQVRGGGAAGCAEGCRYRLGPAVELEWQFRTMALGFREIAVHLYDRYRTRYENAAGEKVEGSAANELDGGVQGSIALSRSVALVMALDGRHHTGLDVDETVATAAYAGGGATLGVGFGTPRFTVQPFVRGQLGRMRTGERALQVTGWSAGLSMTSTF